MARLSSQAKAGFYPTPWSVVTDLANILEIKTSKEIKILDPCCGEGNALYDLKQSFPMLNTYGVELDSNRYLTAKEKIDNVLNCDAISEFRCTNGAFDILWENPPYDFDVRSGDELSSVRLEKKFLQNHLRYLKSDGGILIYIIPITVLKDVKGLLTRFYDLQILAFPKEVYKPFKQIVIIGRTSKGSDRTNYLKNAELIDSIINNVNFDTAYEELATTDDPKVKYIVDSSNREELVTFYTSRINPEEAVRVLESSPNYRAFKSIQQSKVIQAISPLTELTSGHLAMLIAAGMIDGLIEKNGERLVVKGVVQSSMKDVDDASDESKAVTRKNYQIVINALDLNTGDIMRVK